MYCTLQSYFYCSGQAQLSCIFIVFVFICSEVGFFFFFVNGCGTSRNKTPANTQLCSFCKNFFLRLSLCFFPDNYFRHVHSLWSPLRTRASERGENDPFLHTLNPCITIALLFFVSAFV